MALMVEELVASPKKEIRPPNNSRSNNAKIVKNLTLLEALAKGGCVTTHTTEDGKVKIKILVKKQDLKQLLGMNNGSGTAYNSSTSVERKLFDLMKRKRASQAKEHQSCYWRPALQSIPEEY